MVNWKTILVAHSHFAFATPPLQFMFVVVRRRNNFLGSRNNLIDKFAGHMSPLALLHACMLVITDAIMKTTTIMSRIAIMIVVVASDRGEGRGVPEVTDTLHWYLLGPGKSRRMSKEDLTADNFSCTEGSLCFSSC